MEFVYDDGGRAEAGFKGITGDCVCRAISIATQKPYKEIYDLINKYGKAEKQTKRVGVVISITVVAPVRELAYIPTPPERSWPILGGSGSPP